MYLYVCISIYVNYLCMYMYVYLCMLVVGCCLFCVQSTSMIQALYPFLNWKNSFTILTLPNQKVACALLNSLSLGQVTYYSPCTLYYEESFYNCVFLMFISVLKTICFVTGRVLRIYASGSLAAESMQTYQSVLSQCCRGVKESFAGFGWRFYEGDPSKGKQ